MARIRSRFQPWGDKAEHAHYDDLRRGAMDDAFWDEDELVDYHKPGKKKKVHRGCPGNDNKEHVYVDVMSSYTYWVWDYKLQRRVMKKSKWTYYACAGCEKRAPRGYKP